MGIIIKRILRNQMKAAFGIALLAIAAEANRRPNCCVATFPTADLCGTDCNLWSDSDWCNASAENCASCGNWCDSDDTVEGTTQDVLEVIEGVLFGALKAEGITDIETCVKDVSPLVTDLETAFKDFEDGSFHKIAAGIDELGHFLAQVATTMEDCGRVLSGDDITTLKNMGEAFLHPKKLLIESAVHVLLNGVSIYDDIKTASTDFDAKKYEEAGEVIGDIAAKVLWGSKSMGEPFVQ